VIVRAKAHDDDSDDVADGMKFATAWQFSAIGLHFR
jgi:hypothetical protein